MTSEAHQAAMQRLKALLLQRWEPRRLDDCSFSFPWAAGCIPFSCYAEINPDLHAFIFRAINPLKVEPPRRALVAELLHRINYDQPIGNWAINLDTGDVRFKNGFYFRNEVPTENMMRNTIHSSLSAIYHDIMAIVKLQTGGETLEQALAVRGEDHGIGITKGMRVPGQPKMN
ncbi:MAG TPA: hypothetical protein VFA77_15155 [Candidatus Eisenbacteria bacterium]|nr:hypothetical protein [Candidatus Eisenbacteria bacterium]